LLDDKSGVVAYLWKQTPFAETSMTNVSGKIFTSTVSNQTVGSIITYACKFAFAGGLAVTKYLSYTVGNACLVGLESSPELKQRVYPNPVQSLLHFQLPDEQNKIALTDMAGYELLNNVVSSSKTLDMSVFKPGIYVLRIENKHGVQYIKVIKK
jgi:hypothetical protein